MLGKTLIAALLFSTSLAAAQEAAVPSAASAADATPTTDATPWLAMQGCWRFTAEDAKDAMLCVLPVDGDPLSADLASVTDGVETSRSRVRADGTRDRFASGPCAGSEVARFSFDGARVYFLGSQRCGEDPETRTTALFAITGEMSLLHVYGQDRLGVSEAYYRTLRPVRWEEIPRILAPALSGLESASYAARRENSRLPLTAADVIETSRSVSVPLTELWIAAQVADMPGGYTLAEDERLAMEDAKVPSRVVNLLVALNNPLEYSVSLASNGATVRSALVPSQEAVRNALRFQEFQRAIAARRSGRADGTMFSSCRGIETLGALGGGGFGTVLFVPAGPQIIGLMGNCPQLARNMPLEAMQAIYGAYAGVTDNLGGEPPRDPRTIPGRHPDPDPIPINGLGTKPSNGESGVRRAADTPRTRQSPGARDQPTSRPAHSSGVGHPAPPPIPGRGVGSPSSSGPAPKHERP